jgi:hypothetical protein
MSARHSVPSARLPRHLASDAIPRAIRCRTCSDSCLRHCPETHPATGHTCHLAGPAAPATSRHGRTSHLTAWPHQPPHGMAAPATSRHGRGRRTLAYAAEHLFQRERHFLRQSRRSPVVRRRTVRRLGGHDTTALAALHLTEPTDHTHAATPCAMVEIARPVVGSLAARADQYLLVTPDPALPGAVPAVRIHLPRTTAIAGHRVPPSSLSPADVQAPSPGRRLPSGTRRCHAPEGSG